MGRRTLKWPHLTKPMSVTIWTLKQLNANRETELTYPKLQHQIFRPIGFLK